MAKYVFGIDLGTTYSCIAYVDETGRATVVPNQEGDNTTPSVVNFAGENEIVVGQVAKDNAVIEPENTVQLVKTLIGRSDFAINYNGEDKSPEEVSSYILRKVTGDAAKQLNTEVKDVVITCPAYFGTAERTATKNAGEIAGLNVLEIISEPTAAALYYGCARSNEEKTVLVFDLGGGTFDVTVMNISAERIEVVCSDGNHELGGKDWDEAVMRYIADEFTAQTGVDDFDEYAQQDLRIKTEKAKWQLSQRDKTPIALDVAGARARIELTREKFNELTETLLAEAIEKTQACIDLAKEKGYTVSDILLVGGSTRMPQVTAALKERFQMEPQILDPDEAVAKGAAIHAVNVYVNHQKNIAESIGEAGAAGAAADGENVMTIGGATINPEDYQEELAVKPEMMTLGGSVQKIVVATTKSFGIRANVKGEPKICNLILKNVPMEDGVISVTQQFGTNEADQRSVQLDVFESDAAEEIFEVDEDLKLGDAELELPAGLPEHSPIEITFILNQEGILELTGKDVSSGNKISVTMQTQGVMAQEKVEELKEKTKSLVVM